ncbi:MAG: LamG domain-containing protein [Planctomycetes bacterium]|nr:LamG domain-containing protein [Planctomycetota bacterium]
MGTKRTFIIATLVLAGTAGLTLGDVVTGLLGHWPLDGDATDLSGNGHEGTLMGDAHFSTDGVFAGALALDGDGDFVEMRGYQGPMKSPWTLACWVQTTGAGDMDILSWGTEGGGLKVEFRFNAGRLRIEHGNGNIRGNTVINDGEWHHGVAQLPAGGVIKDVLFYLDGKPLALFATIGNGNNPFNTTPGIDFNIGRSGPLSGRYFQGQIDDVRVYDRLLSAEEIGQLVVRPQAHAPKPANGAVGVEVPLLQWTAGDGAALHTVYLGTSPDLTEADRVAERLPAAVYYHAPGLQPGTTYYWRVDEIEADLATVHTGAVWSFVTQDIKAYGPSPAEGDNRVTTAPVLTWLPGRAALEHHVYFGASREAVAQGTPATDKGVIKETSFTPGELQSATTYYWRVDEVVAGGVIQMGAVWSFTTILAIDDFESYTDDEGNRIYETWIDGWTNGTGSTVGYTVAPFAEQKTVHGGKQALPLDYNNLHAPYYSEAERQFAPTQDWTINGLDTLVVYLRGRATNGPARVYLIVKDTSNRTATVSHPDSAVVTVGKWVEWQIALGDLTGVNAARIKQIVLGIGDKTASAPGAAGLILVDDFYVFRAAPAQN